MFGLSAKVGSLSAGPSGQITSRFSATGLVNSNKVGSDQRNICSLYVHRIKARIRIKKLKEIFFYHYSIFVIVISSELTGKIAIVPSSANVQLSGRTSLPLLRKLF